MEGFGSGEIVGVVGIGRVQEVGIKIADSSPGYQDTGLKRQTWLERFATQLNNQDLFGEI